MFAQIARILTFRATLADFERLGNGHLAAGLVAAWLVGIGRYWDNPRVGVLQHAGVGSVVYVFLLSTLLFVLGLGLRPERWSYRHLLTFVTLTSFPGLIYAIPVERFLAPESARMANLWFLAVVALWRMALYALYLKRYAGLSFLSLTVQLLLPVSAIVFALSALNLEHAVFDIMSGVRRETTSADEAYMLVILMTFISVYVAPVLLALNVVLAVLAARSRKRRPGIRNAEAPLPPPWKNVSINAIGGLYAIGFAPGTEDLLVISAQGRGLFNAATGERLARDDDDSWSWYENPPPRAEGIGPYAGTWLPVAGVDGGALAQSTTDGWSLALRRADSLVLSSPDGVEVQVPGLWPGEPVRAYGFSSTGRAFAVALGSHTLFLYSLA